MNATRAPRRLRPRSSALLVSLIGAIGIALSNCGGDSGANGANGPPSDGAKDGGTVSLDATTSSGGDAHAAVPDGGDAASAIDAGASDDGGGNAFDAGPPPTCGPPPARYTVLTGANAGLVRDNVTALVWMNNSVGGQEPPQTQSPAASYCSGRGMRLPTESEALTLAAKYASCAFGQWSTWTSTAVGSTDAWVVDYLGDASPQVANNFPSAVLCVRDATDP